MNIFKQIQQITYHVQFSVRVLYTRRNARTTSLLNPPSFYSNDSPAKVIFPQSFRLKITFILRYLIEITFAANEIIHFFVHLNKQASDY